MVVANHRHRQEFNLPSAALCAAADAAVVLLVIALGQFATSQPLSVDGVAAGCWPFVVGLIGGYLGVVIARLTPISVAGGSVVSAKAFILSMVLRAGVQQDPTPVSFVLLSGVILVVLMIGWRVLASRRRAPVARLARVNRRPVQAPPH